MLPEKSNVITEEFKKSAKNEGLKAPIDVNYVARAGKYSCKYTGAFNVLSNCLSMDYLWQNVRVHGGAYGCMMNIDPFGNIGFTSYRDPNITRTNDVYSNVVEYIKSLSFTDEDLLKYKIGAFGSSQLIMHVNEMGDLARTHYIRGLDYEARCKIREEMLDATMEDILKLADSFEEALNDSVICVLGNADKIKEAKKLFTEVRNLNK